ncbi:hypothetical protein I79_000450 [Cricetulus griseus]|uniref:Uncharacterized protein n=1 Tax=Cricetulus griseus TaxID=10029 RepID=G3GSC7_CRIGR|nr:hypothetical protein I79_000450 [Cricetulus griseus]
MLIYTEVQNIRIFTVKLVRRHTVLISVHVKEKDKPVDHTVVQRQSLIQYHSNSQKAGKRKVARG